MPRTRRATSCRRPARWCICACREEGAHVRVDTGVRQGDTVTPFYDPMIAKVIVHDRDRTSAMRRMAALMGETEVVGVTTNAALLKALCSHPAFVGGEVDTGFIERHRDELFAKPGAGRRSRARRGHPGAAASNGARPVPARVERSVVDRGAERLPAARRGPRRGALEGRRARGDRDRPPPARRRHRPRAARRHARGARAARRRRPAGDPAGRRHLHGHRGAPRRRRTASTTRVFADGASRRLRLVDPLDVTQYEAAGLGRGARCARRCPARSSTCASRPATR